MCTLLIDYFADNFLVANSKVFKSIMFEIQIQIKIVPIFRTESKPQKYVPTRENKRFGNRFFKLCCLKYNHSNYHENMYLWK